LSLAVDASCGELVGLHERVGARTRVMRGRTLTRSATKITQQKPQISKTTYLAQYRQNKKYRQWIQQVGELMARMQADKQLISNTSAVTCYHWCASQLIVAV
jgi:hypothetical protein